MNRLRPNEYGEFNLQLLTLGSCSRLAVGWMGIINLKQNINLNPTIFYCAQIRQDYVGPSAAMTHHGGSIDWNCGKEKYSINQQLYLSEKLLCGAQDGRETGSGSRLMLIQCRIEVHGDPSTFNLHAPTKLGDWSKKF